MFSLVVTTLAALLPMTNPIGGLAVFAGLTADDEAADRNKQAYRTAIYVFAILAVFALIGSPLLKALGLSIPALQIAGGLVVGWSGFRMLNPQPALSDSEASHAQAKMDVSFSPMALPMIAGPGAIGVVIALAARHHEVMELAGVVAGIAIVAALFAVLLRYGTPLIEKMGPSGIGALTRIMGFLILAIGVALLIEGVQGASAAS